jgi:predicted RecB family nuclease
MSILQRRKEALQRDYIKELKQKNPDVQSYSLENLKSRSDFLVNSKLKAEGLEADCGILTKVDGSSFLGRYSYEPTIFIGTYRIDKYQKLESFFIGHVLEKIQGKIPVAGRIIGMDGKSHKVRLENSSKALIPLLEPLQEWADAPSPEPPPLILNKQCDYCQFQSTCKEQAEQEDNLSLLDAISTPKAVRRYEKKGIFTVKQLSYLFKPRRRKKRARSSQLIHKPELQALAIRTSKIYLQELPELSRQSIEFLLDIEGIPDQGFYYLIGLLVCDKDASTYHSFWADTPEDEAMIWHQFLEKVSEYPDALIYHYGSYEPRAISKLARRYDTGVGGVESRLVNVNSYIYGKVYFPVWSNRLKELGKFIGASWTSPEASGLQSLVWRYYWDENQNAEYQELLVTYNKEDCQILKLLTDKLSEIKRSAEILSEVDFANQPKQYETEAGEQIHRQFKTIIRFSSKSYDKRKISFRQDKTEESKEDIKRKKSSPKKGYPGQRKVNPKPTRIVEVQSRKTCPKCENEPLRPTERVCKRLVIDIVPTKNGIKKTVVKYAGVYGHCPKCGRDYLPQELTKYTKVHCMDMASKPGWYTKE